MQRVLGAGAAMAQQATGTVDSVGSGWTVSGMTGQAP